MYCFQNAEEVAEVCGASPDTARRLVRAFNEGGLKVCGKKSPGRPPLLTPAEQALVQQAILVHPRDLGYDFSNWTSLLASYHVERVIGVVTSARTMLRVFRRQDCLPFAPGPFPQPPTPRGSKSSLTRCGNACSGRELTSTSFSSTRAPCSAKQPSRACGGLRGQQP